MVKKNIFLAAIFGGLFFISSYSLVPASDKVACGSKPVKVIRLKLQCQRNDIIDSIADIFQRQIRQHCGATVKTFGTANLTVEFAIDNDNSIGNEGFRIEDNSDKTIRIVGNDERGLLYGVGKFLRTSKYSQEGFVPGNWRGTSIPKLSVRGIYFASHFYNYYVTAPQHELQHYIEELALWGYNAVMICYDMHHYTGFDDPKAVKFRKLIGNMLERAKSIGMDISFVGSTNTGYSSTPDSLRITEARVKGYPCDICPSKPEGMELILKNFKQNCEWYAQFSPRYICLWPYDQGGCGCELCIPWPTNGFIRTSKLQAEIIKKKLPTAKIILSTWHFNDQEWQEFLKKLSEKPDWIDYYLASSFRDLISCCLEYGFPTPLLGFPDISMSEVKIAPWAGYGANPCPAHLQKVWNKYGSFMVGAFPYSEGIYEDINKAICAQLYWDPNRTTMDITKEYIYSEYSPKVVDEVLEAIRILESNNPRTVNIELLEEIEKLKADNDKASVDTSKDNLRHEIKESALKAYELIKSANAKLDSRAKNSWRWRVLYLRALIDSEIFKNNSLKNQTIKQAFEELIEIYHAQDAQWRVKPPIVLTK